MCTLRGRGAIIRKNTGRLCAIAALQRALQPSSVGHFAPDNLGWVHPGGTAVYAHSAVESCLYRIQVPHAASLALALWWQQVGRWVRGTH